MPPSAMAFALRWITPPVTVIGDGAFGAGVPAIQSRSASRAAFITYFWFAMFDGKVHVVAGYDGSWVAAFKVK